MTPAAWLLAHLLSTPLSSSMELELSPVLTQSAILFRSDEVSAGGVGGGAGVQLLYRDLYLAQLDASALWGFGNAAATRLAIGVQRPGSWSPAGWLTLGVLFGHRVEFLAEDGTQPPRPTWSMGVRAAPLRFASDAGVVSALEPGIATDYRGGLWIELTVLQVGFFL